MTTQELIDELIILHNGWSRSGEHGVLRYLNMANRILVSNDAEQNIIFGDDDELPSIDTTTGTLSYEMPTTVRRVKSVVVKADDLVGNAYDYGNTRRTLYPNTLVFGGVEYIRMPFIKTSDKISSAVPAMIRFTVDPGTYTEYYRRVSYKSPTDILSESIEHDLDESSAIEFLLPAASALIAGVQNYTYSDAVQYVRNVIVPQYTKKLGDGDQGEWDFEPVSRGF